jgi:hypothetical protein
MRTVDRNNEDFKAVNAATSIQTLIKLLSLAKKAVAPSIEVIKNLNTLYDTGQGVAIAATPVGKTKLDVGAIQHIRLIDKDMVMPKKANIIAAFKPIQDVWHTIALLEQMEIRLESDSLKASNKDALAEEVRKTHEELHLLSEAGLDTLNKIALKHKPELFTKLAKATAVALVTELDGTKGVVDKDTIDVYASTQDMKPNGNIQFHAYIQVFGHEMSNGYEAPEYFIILTCRINSRGFSEYYIGAIDSFHPPGMFKVGKHITGTTEPQIKRELVSALRATLSLSNVKARLGNSEVRVTAREIELALKNVIEGFEQAKVFSTAIHIVMKKGVTKTRMNEGLIADILATLNPLIGNRIRTLNNTLYKLGTTKSQQRRSARTIQKGVELKNGKLVLSIILTPTGA